MPPAELQNDDCYQNALAECHMTGICQFKLPLPHRVGAAALLCLLLQVFPATRDDKQRAVQAVEVLAGPRPSSSSTGSAGNGLQRFTFTFCMERIATGPYKDCWMTVGVRFGDYSV
jgi:hypothetical protein